MPALEPFGALKGLRILDLTHALAGPFCTQMLAHHGADVIKIETPAGGDMSRHIGPFTADDTQHEYGGLYQCCNNNKRGITLDLKNPAAREILLRLVDSADALVENFRAGVMERFGLSYETVSARNPRLVYTSIRGFGDPRSGRTKYTDWPAVDIVAQAMGGLMSLTGPDADNPTKVGGGPGDTIPGLYAAFATMAALWEARISGNGQYVDVSMVDCILALSEQIFLAYSYSDEVPRPMGNRMPRLVPFGTVRAKDGWFSLAVSPQTRSWSELCNIMGTPELIDDPRFATNEERVRHRDEVYALVEEFTSRHTKAELIELLGGRIPAAPVYDARDIFNDPYFAAREMLVRLEQPGSKREVAVSGIPAKLLRTPGVIYRRAPLLGEHTEEVLTELGLEKDEILSLRQSGAVA